LGTESVRRGGGTVAELEIVGSEGVTEPVSITVVESPAIPSVVTEKLAIVVPVTAVVFSDIITFSASAAGR